LRIRGYFSKPKGGHEQTSLENTDRAKPENKNKPTRHNLYVRRYKGMFTSLHPGLFSDRLMTKRMESHFVVLLAMVHK